MQQLDSLTLKHLASELNEMLAGSKVNKIQHLTPHEFVIGFWGARMDRRQRLYINVNPQNPCCFLVSVDELEQFVLPTLQKPTGFCMLLRKHLSSGRLISIETLPGERVLNMVFENYNELGNRVRLILSLELMGKYSNMLLVDDLPNLILGAAHTVSDTMSTKREVMSGLPYIVPPMPEGKQLIFCATAQDLNRTLSSVDLSDTEAVLKTLLVSYWGLATPILRRLLKELAKEKISDFSEQLYQGIDALDSGKELSYFISSDFESFGFFPETKGQLCSSAHEMIYSYMLKNLSLYRLKRFKQELSQAIQRQKRKLMKRQKEQTPGDSKEIEQLNHYGNLILNAVSSKELVGMPSKNRVELFDYLSQKPIEIVVKANVPWLDNAQRYFRKSKKERVRQKLYKMMGEKLEQELDYLDSLALMLEQADTLLDGLSLRDDLILAGILKDKEASSQKSRQKRKEKKKKITGIFETASSDGMKIKVGKSGQANAELVGRLSRAEDLWLHVHEMPGSHVLVQTEKQAVSDQTLLEAASLAVYFSSARQSKNVPVIYTLIRYVKKIPDSYPGHVNYREEKTVFITADLSLIETLLKPQS